jgi:hypothetical protein
VAIAVSIVLGILPFGYALPSVFSKTGHVAIHPRETFSLWVGFLSMIHQHNQENNMEYLELEGLVKIQDNCDRKALNVLLKELDSTAFHGDGFIVTCTINQSLFMRGEGAISTSTLCGKRPFSNLRARLIH